MIEFMVGKQVSLEDFKEVGRLAEAHFKTAENPDQLPGSELSDMAFWTRFPLAGNIIKDDDRVIGHTFVLPCDSAGMRDFLLLRMNERELFYRIRDSVVSSSYSSLYVCSAQVISGYEGRGIATDAAVHHVQSYLPSLNVRPVLFYWPLVQKGDDIMRRVSQRTGLPVMRRAK